MADENQNKEALKDAIQILEQIAANNATPKTIKKSTIDMVNSLKNDEDSMSVRAANATSMLDDITQDPNMPSFVRVSLWQAVSKLESIRE
ncbi:MAG: UPF0147 family protein [Nitrosopumilaceae archaeon]|jgi:hypothetical protein